MTAFVLDIAGSESTGGAGCQADLRTFHQLGVYGACTLTCIVAFDPAHGWNHRFVPVDPQVIKNQTEATLSCWNIDAVKIGMLGTVPAIDATAEILSQHSFPHVVVDPVLICKGQEAGAALDIDNALREKILPLATVLTPNLFETETLSGMENISTVDELTDAAKRIADAGTKAVLAKGGANLPGDNAVDVLWDGHEATVYSVPKVGDLRVSGAGDSLAAALTAELAKGKDLHAAVSVAKDFVTRGIAQSLDAGTPFGVVWQG
ncbi:bifunctional hydroxymethylpyrimidine kinase/phosphomethylpyrimidine kinase [Lawsonella clevelandensis]|uniref:pyridoxal kinase n=1 Tax=Lawsonella clevelandensis TaxID=1528099 RepID=A0A5E3ZYK9_9ACTN|nr:bifunctional hydroxymethylpyrimidine kinase/phosphomethylpyrimidine kinase [Lawsonella clevelandensis]VHO01383.1 Pyridoxine kinase [Lawsonella clevelandensis]